MITKTGFFSKLKGAFRRDKTPAADISDQVIIGLEEQLKENPNNFRLRLKLADTCLSRGEREKALDEYCKSARLYLKNDFIPLAIATYKKILSEDPKHLEANLELGRIYKQKKLNADAVTYYLQAFNVYRENDRPNEALEILETILETAPDKEPYRLLLRKLFPEYQESAKSIYSDIIITHKSLEKNGGMSTAEPAGEDDFFDLGAELGEDFDDFSISSEHLESSEQETHDHGVEEIFQTMKSTRGKDRQDSENDRFHYNLALAYNELKMPEQALRESEEALKSAGFRLPTLLLRSRIFLNQGAYSAALSQVQQGLLEKGLTRNDFLTFKRQLGQILKEMGHYKQALEALREAYTLDPDSKSLAGEIEELEKLTSSPST
ncbi:MAG: tetratricopeptide repeat protein [Deltaproteobacteria bacterium]|nr:tetratricopeptide repeat protein [Deltaproteobacteria bacterium]